MSSSSSVTLSQSLSMSSQSSFGDGSTLPSQANQAGVVSVALAESQYWMPWTQVPSLGSTQ